MDHLAIAEVAASASEIHGESIEEDTESKWVERNEAE